MARGSRSGSVNRNEEDVIEGLTHSLEFQASWRGLETEGAAERAQQLVKQGRRKDRFYRPGKRK